jgi:hypothetical protein
MRITKAEFLLTLRAERARFEALIDAVGRSRMDMPGVSGRYSMKDIVAHVTTYERALVVWLQEARAGRIYVDAILDRPDVDARNAIVYKLNRDRSADEILQSFAQTFDELEGCVERLTEKELTKAESAAWFVTPRWHQKRAVWECIADDSYEHHRQHTPDIERWLAEHGPASPP